MATTRHHTSAMGCPGILTGMGAVYGHSFKHDGLGTGRTPDSATLPAPFLGAAVSRTKAGSV